MRGQKKSVLRIRRRERERELTCVNRRANSGEKAASVIALEHAAVRAHEPLFASAGIIMRWAKARSPCARKRHT